MKFLAVMLIGLQLGGCVPLVVGGVAGYEIEHHRARCMHYFGNPYCHPGYGEERMSIGVHR